MEIRIINRSHHALPSYATEQSAGMDLRANIEEPITLKPMQRALIKTGLFMALPPGFEAQVRPRSGLALKHGIGREEDMRLPIGLELESGGEDERIRVLGIETIG